MNRYEYHQIYMPDSPMAYKNGCVSEHRYYASLKLGRPLKHTEYVHHIDEDKSNNSLDNLMVFKTNSDHIAFHKGAEAVLDGDVYYCPTRNRARKRKLYYICPICGGMKSSKNAKMCLKCFDKMLEENIPCTKDELIRLIIKYPFVKIGQMYNVSDNAVRKWCKRYGIPYKYNELKEFKTKFSF